MQDVTWSSTAPICHILFQQLRKSIWFIIIFFSFFPDNKDNSLSPFAPPPIDHFETTIKQSLRSRLMQLLIIQYLS